MNSFIALLRGINVGGHKKILMADLRVLFEKLGFENVRTFIQSGNVVFQTSNENLTNIEDRIKYQVLNEYGIEVPVLVKSYSELKAIIKECPFSDEKKEKAYFTFLHKKPQKELIELTNLISCPNEEFLISKMCVYFYSSSGYGNVKCNNNFFEKKLKVAATTRNFKTLMKLIELSN